MIKASNCWLFLYLRSNATNSITFVHFRLIPKIAMAKNNPTFSMISYGVYTQWDERSKQLPKLVEPTTDIPLRENIEFGFIVKVKKAKNEKLAFTIYHPDIPDKDGKPMPPFTGDVFVGNNDWDFYLGDTIWLPLNDKVGHWRMTLEYKGKVVAEKTFIVDIEFHGERTLGEGRTYFKPKRRW